MKRYELTHLENKIEATAKGKEESKFELSDNMAIEALAYLKTLRIKSTEDALLFMASANFINKYIKIGGKKKLYHFKEDVFFAADILAEGKIPKVTYGFHHDKSVGRVLVVQIGEIQFSFHDDRKLDKYQNLSADQNLTWREVRLQPHSKFVYEETKKYVWSRYNDRKKAEVSDAAEKLIDSQKTFRRIMFSRSEVSRQHAKQFATYLDKNY